MIGEDSCPYCTMSGCWGDCKEEYGGKVVDLCGIREVEVSSRKKSGGNRSTTSRKNLTPEDRAKEALKDKAERFGLDLFIDVEKITEECWVAWWKPANHHFACGQLGKGKTLAGCLENAEQNVFLMNKMFKGGK